jgi:glycosyltransferase involved in cell wall biosynthesis
MKASEQKSPALSVIMPVFNQKQAYLEAAVNSILHQTFTDFELLIIDDGSTDKNCLETMQRFANFDSRIRIIKNEKNSGIVYSLNRGLDESRGILVARMDSDDISVPERLEKQTQFLKEHPECDLAGTWVTIMDENGTEIGSLKFPTDYETIKNTILIRNPIIHPTWMFRKSLVAKNGKYDPAAVNTEDYEFLLRIARRHHVSNIPEPLLRYRFNTHGLSFGKNKLQEKNALKIRLRALKNYGYPAWQVLYLSYPAMLYFLVPSFIKKLLIRVSFKRI